MNTYTHQLEEQNEQLMHINALLEKKIVDLESILIRIIPNECDEFLKNGNNKEHVKYLISMLGVDVIDKIIKILVVEYEKEVKRVLLENYKAGKYE